MVQPLCEWLHQRLEVLNNERLTTSYKMRGQLDYVDQYGKFVRDITHKVARKKKKKKKTTIINGRHSRYDEFVFGQAFTCNKCGFEL